MNAYTTRGSLLSTARTAHPEHYANRPVRPTLFARIAAYYRRQATLNELRQMSDRELADIGLERNALHLAFAPAYAR